MDIGSVGFGFYKNYVICYANNTLKEEARGEFVRYADKIMSSSFGDFDLELTHSCGVKEGQMKSDVSSPTLMGDEVQSQSAQLNPIVGLADELFYDNAAASVNNTNDDLQRIRDARNKNHVQKIKGELMHCKKRGCQGLFSVNDIVDMALECHAGGCKLSAIHKNRLDRATYGYPMTILHFQLLLEVMR
jgi:hypothetical protein